MLFVLSTQAIGAGGMINEQCKNFVREYVPQILHIVDTMPPEQALSHLPAPQTGWIALCVSPA